jgi:hypothetical protein
LQVLRPLTWVDWLDPDLRSTYARSGERARGALRIWMEAAIRNGVVYSSDEVMSKELHSLAGRGILSSPARGLPLEIVSDGKWPTPSDPVLFRATQPANTLPGSVWGVFDTEGVNRTPQDAFVQAEGGFAELELAHDDWMDLVPSFDVRVDWYNAVDPPGGTVLPVRRPGIAGANRGG